MDNSASHPIQTTTIIVHAKTRCQYINAATILIRLSALVPD